MPKVHSSIERVPKGSLLPIGAEVLGVVMKRHIVRTLFCTILLVFSGSAIAQSLQDLWDEVARWEREVRNGEDRLRDAEAVVRDAEATFSRVSEAPNAARQEVNSIGRQLSDARSNLTSLERGLNNARNRASSASGTVDEWKTKASSAAKQAKELQERLLATELIAYDFTTPLTLTFNTSTGAFFLDLDLGSGLKYDTKKLQALLAGDIQLPEVNPVEAAATAVAVEVEQRSDYRRFRDDLYGKYPGGSVYVASERFVRWAGLERFGEGGLKCLAASCDDVAKDALAILELEYADIVAWLRALGEQEAERQAVLALNSILDGKAPDMTITELRATVTTLPVEYVATLRGTKSIPSEITDKVTGGKGTIDEVTGPVPHLAFSLAIDRAADLQAPREQALQWIRNGRTEPYKNMVEVIRSGSGGGGALGKLLSDAGGAGQFAGNLSASLRQRFHSAFGLDEAELVRLFSSSLPVIDLKESPAGSEIRNIFQNAVIGNDGSVTLDALDLELSCLRISMRANLRHRHSWGSVKEAAQELVKWGYGKRLVAEELLGAADREALSKARDAAKAASDRFAAVTNELNTALEAVNAAERQVSSAS